MAVTEELIDRLAIRDLLENWTVWRDAADWERLSTVWHAFLALTKLITLRFGCGWPTLKVWRTSRCGSILRFSSLPR